MLFFTLCWLWALGAFFSWLLCPSLTCSHFFIYLLVIFGALFYSLALQDDPCSLYIFPTLVIESAIFRRTPDFCYWRMLLEMKVYVLRVLFATEVMSLLSLHKQGNACVSANRLPWWLRWQRICLEFRRPGLSPWVRKIPFRREWLPTAVVLPEEFHG